MQVCAVFRSGRVA